MKRVFTNGVFDILHVGHVRLLDYCKSKIGCVHVIVGVNSDESARRLKGPGRPINMVEDRVEVLEALHDVDEVIVFDEDTPYELIKSIKPDIIVKGGDYSLNEVVGCDLVNDVRIFDYQDGFSTTKTIQRMRHR